MPEAVSLTLAHTNVHFVLIGQEDVFAKFWAQLAHAKQIGLAQRFLLCFGVRQCTACTKWNAFFQSVTLPILEQLFTIVLHRVGPRTPAPPENFERTAQQEEEVDNLGQIRTLFEGRESAHKVFRQAMSKTMYWFGTSLLLNRLMEHCWSHALARTVEKLPTAVSDPAFCAAAAFVHRRYVFGHAVLSVSAQEAAWLVAERALPKEGDLAPTILKLLRGNPGSCVTRDHILRVELGLSRILQRGDEFERKVAEQHVGRLWQALKELGVGTLPLFVFGPREVDLLAAQVPGMLASVVPETERPAVMPRCGESDPADSALLPTQVREPPGKRGAATRFKRQAARPEFVSATDLGGVCCCSRS